MNRIKSASRGQKSDAGVSFRKGLKPRLLILRLLTLLVCAAFLSAQSLVELAKKEKERREELKESSGDLP